MLTLTDTHSEGILDQSPTAQLGLTVGLRKADSPGHVNSVVWYSFPLETHTGLIAHRDVCVCVCLCVCVCVCVSKGSAGRIICSPHDMCEHWMEYVCLCRGTLVHTCGMMQAAENMHVLPSRLNPLDPFRCIRLLYNPSSYHYNPSL